LLAGKSVEAELNETLHEQLLRRDKAQSLLPATAGLSVSVALKSIRIAQQPGSNSAAPANKRQARHQ
jgi:hypothetical protein